MTNPYTPQSISGYNSSPPTDDGAITANNEVSWATIKTKLPDPVKVLAENINTSISAAFDQQMFNAVNIQTTTYIIQAADRGKVVTGNGTFTITMLDAATATAGFAVTIKNVGTGVITIDTAGETIDGAATKALSTQYDSVLLMTDGTNWFVASVVETVIQGKTGDVKMFAGAAVETGWLLCDASAQNAVTDTTLQPLFDVIGNLYGGTDNTNFLLPGTAGRAAIGTGTSDASDGTVHTLAQKQGTETHTLTISEMPIHDHDINGGGTSQSGVDRNQPGSGTGIVSGSTGGGAAHSIMQSSIAFNFIIKK